MRTEPRPAVVNKTDISTFDNAAYEAMKKVDVHPGGLPTADDDGEYVVPFPPLTHQPLPAIPTVGRAEETTSPRPVTGTGEEEGEDGMYEAIPGAEYLTVIQ